MRIAWLDSCQYTDVTKLLICCCVKCHTMRYNSGADPVIAPSGFLAPVQMSDVFLCVFVCVSAELNSVELQGCSSDNSLNSNASLPSVQSHRRHTERRVASWAVCFERLLQDPLGIRYFSVRCRRVTEVRIAVRIIYFFIVESQTLNKTHTSQTRGVLHFRQSVD